MGGKGAVFLVLGFSIIFLVVANNFNSLSSNSIENMTTYFIETTAYNIAVSGANMASNEIFINKRWDAGYQDTSFLGGKLNVYISNPLYGSGKVTICHVTHAVQDLYSTLNVLPGTVADHLSHGDHVGACAGDTLDPEMITIISEGTFQGVTKVVIVNLRPSYFSKFGNFYSNISAQPATGDTFNGPFHTQGTLSTYGTPVFWGKATALNGVSKGGSPKDPKFYGGFESGVDIPLEFDTSGMRKNASKLFYDTTKTGKKSDVRLYFNSNGTVTWQWKLGSGAWTASRTQPLSTLAPNGLIYVEKGNIYTKGTVNGAVTIVTTKKGASGCGNVYQEDDIVYNDNPKTNPASLDVLGIVAEENIRIVYNNDTKHADIRTQASMFSLNGNIGPDDALVDNDDYLKRWLILGGLIAKTTRVTAHYSGSNPYEGYQFVHSYDDRFMTYVPPYFPHTKNFEVVSWYE
ncbi:MAG: hypothetical protein V1720_05980 [bacterium]